MQTLYIDSPLALQQLCDQIATPPWLALDTEFLRETSYHPKLCLLQLATRDLAACIDPLAIDDLSPLLEILYDQSVVKVFHAAYQDLEIFLHRWQRLPSPVFDTQPAAALLGVGDQVGYGTLVEQMLGISLDKGHARTDWTRRPLSTQQIDYAYNDVIYLGQLYEKINAQLHHLGREGWLQEEFRELTNPATYRVEPDAAWKKVKGRQVLRGVQYAILQQLAAWREEEALRRDRPRRHILKDEVMLDLCRRRPPALEQLKQIRGVEERDVERFGKEWLKRIALGSELPKALWPKEHIPPKPGPELEVKADLLSAALRMIAVEQKMTPASIALRKEIEQLVAGDPQCPLRHGWRYVVAGKRLQKLLDGGAELALRNGQVSLNEAG